MEGKEFSWRPTVVGECGGHGRGTTDPAIALLIDPKPNAEALVLVAEVVETTNDKHAERQGVLLLSQAASATG